MSTPRTAPSKKAQWPKPPFAGWPYNNRWGADNAYMAESSCGPVIHETPEEALIRRCRYAAAHPLKGVVTGGGEVREP